MAFLGLSSLFLSCVGGRGWRFNYFGKQEWKGWIGIIGLGEHLGSFRGTGRGGARRVGVRAWRGAGEVKKLPRYLWLAE